MAVRTKTTKAGIVYYVETRGHWERVGSDKREADRLNARRKKEVKAGTFHPRVTGGVAVGRYLAKWLDEKTNRAAGQDRTHIETHVLTRDWFAKLKMEDVRPLHFQQLVNEIKAGPPMLAGKYIANIYGSVRAAFRTALRQEVIHRDVCLLEPGTISKKSEEREPYALADARALLATATGDRLVWVAIAFYTGMRCGEVCGLLWSDLDPGPEPLWALDITKQYGGRRLKTKRRRVAPVHPELRGILEDWRDVGFVDLTGHPPAPGDFIVPNVSRRARTRNHTKSTFYKAFVAGCTAAGVPNRTLHSTRHTMITFARRGRGDKAVLSKVTHNAKGDIVDRYTHRDWLELCEAVLAIGSVLPARSTTRREDENPQETGGAHLGGNHVYSRGFLPDGLAGLSSIPGASTAVRLDLSLSREPRTTPRTSAAGRTGENLESGEAHARPESWALALAAERVLLRSVRVVQGRRLRRSRDAS
jgi:integrase